ncbi:MAG: hypothetical protein ACR2MX_13025 [Cyclobacteriaceae bacterium]
MILVLVSFSSYASLDPVVKVKSTDAKAFALYMSQWTGQVRISIKDINGYVLQNKSFEELNGYAEKYNIKALPNGVYFLEVEDEDMIKVLPITVHGEEVTVGVEENIYKPQVTQLAGYVNVTRVAKNQGPLTVTISDQTGELVFKETFSGDRNLKQRYDLTSLRPGRYSFSFQTQDRVFNEEVDIKNNPMF